MTVRTLPFVLLPFGRFAEPALMAGTFTVRSQTTLTRLVLPCLALAYAMLCTGLYVLCVRQTGGRFIYPLDDSYIHMSLARNLAEHGVFGVTQHEFAAASSSPAWVLMLAALFGLFGAHELIPALASAASGSLLLIAAAMFMRRGRVPAKTQITALIAIVLATPMTVLALSGMEHLLHAAIVITAVWLAAQLLAGVAQARDVYFLFAVLAVGGSVRLETIFLSALIAFLLVFQRRFWLACLTAVAGFLPLVINGIVSTSRGWLWLPNSVILKGVRPRSGSLHALLSTLGGRCINQLFHNPHLIVLIFALAAAYCFGTRRSRVPSRPTDWMILLTVGLMLLHLQFAGTGWLYRYEAYLVALSIFVLAFAAKDFSRFGDLRTPVRLALTVFVAALCLFPLLRRSYAAASVAPKAGRYTFQQQYQMAQFLKTYYDYGSIAANDIGAITFYSHIHLYDLVGLANITAAKARLAGEYTTQTIARESEARHTQIALVYDDWFDNVYLPKLPVSWIRAARWKLPHNEVEGGDTITFYAVNPDERERLHQTLRQFEPNLPGEVRVEYPNAARANTPPNIWPVQYATGSLAGKVSASDLSSFASRRWRRARVLSQLETNATHAVATRRSSTADQLIHLAFFMSVRRYWRVMIPEMLRTQFGCGG